MRLSSKAKLLKKESPPMTSKPVSREQIDPKIIPREEVDTGPVDYDLEMSNAIAEMDRRKIDFLPVPVVKRHEAFIIEGEMTKAANENRTDDFMRYLKE